MASTAASTPVEQPNSHWPRPERAPAAPFPERRRAREMPELAAEEVVRELRSLLSEELAAVDVYRGSAAAAADPGTARRLAAIAGQHGAQAAELERQIRRLGGGHAATRRTRAHRPGKRPRPAGASLRESERLGLASYREALDRVDRVSREAFLGSLIPGQFRSVRLERRVGGFLTTGDRPPIHVCCPP